MTIIETISLIASLASLILAIVAIWLSFKFFDKSNEASDKTIEASKGISASVERLEKLFDKLYSDTFTMMKDTVSDMRKHIWSDKGSTESEQINIEVELEKKATEKVSLLKKELAEDISKIFAKQHMTDTKINSVKDELKTLIEKAVSQTRTLEFEAREETMREYIHRKLRLLRRKQKIIIANDLVEGVIEDGLNPRRLMEELGKMKREGIIDFEGDEINGPEQRIRLL